MTHLDMDLFMLVFFTCYYRIFYMLQKQPLTYQNILINRMKSNHVSEKKVFFDFGSYLFILILSAHLCKI